MQSTAAACRACAGAALAFRAPAHSAAESATVWRYAANAATGSIPSAHTHNCSPAAGSRTARQYIILPLSPRGHQRLVHLTLARTYARGLGVTPDRKGGAGGGGGRGGTWCIPHVANVESHMEEGSASPVSSEAMNEQQCTDLIEGLREITLCVVQKDNEDVIKTKDAGKEDASISLPSSESNASSISILMTSNEDELNKRGRKEENVEEEEEEEERRRRTRKKKRYAGLLLDQYGVLHDGRRPYPAVMEAVKEMARLGSKMVILSNSSRRASFTMKKLTSMGFDPSHFLGAVTSGELTHKFLLERVDPWFASLGHRCVHITWAGRGAIQLTGLNLKIVEDARDADFILVHGTEAIARSSRPGAAGGEGGEGGEGGGGGGGGGGDGEEGEERSPRLADMSDFRKVMKAGLEKGIPMIIANPDVVTVSGSELLMMPGTIGREYEKAGGFVRWMGKPDKVIYEAAVQMMGLPNSMVIAVGDSLEHDIKGAEMAGIDSAFVMAGIHARELGGGGGGGGGGDEAGERMTTNANEISEPSPVTLSSFFRKYDTFPTYTIPVFKW